MTHAEDFSSYNFSMHADQNPFRVDQIHSLPYRFPDGQTLDQRLQPLVEQLQQRPTHTAIVAPHGCGKSTLLKELQYRLNEAGYRTYWFSAAKRSQQHSAGFWHSPVLQEIRRQIGFDRKASSPTAKAATSKSYWATATRHHRVSTKEARLRTVVLLDSGECVRGFAWWRLRRTLRNCHLITTLHRSNRLPTFVHCQASPEIFLTNCRQLLCQSPVADQLSDSRILSIYRDCKQNSRDAFFQLYEICSQMKNE